MSANVEGLVREGMDAVKKGRKDEARTLLMKATELDPYNEDAWLWLSGVLDSVEDQRTCLENVLAINPANDRARKGLAHLSGGGMSAPAPASYSAPSAAPVERETMPTSAEWATSDAPPTRAPDADVDYDDWVTNLNLPASEGPQPGTFTSPFTDLDDYDESDSLGSGPFAADPFALDLEEPAPPTARAAAPPRAPAAPPPPRTPPLDDEPPARPSRSAPAPRRDFELDDEDEVGAFLDEFEDGTPFDNSEGSELFGFIPVEIKATRLPGTNGRSPILLVLLVVLLVLANLGAAAFLVMRVMPILQG